jgi:dihydroorotase
MGRTLFHGGHIVTEETREPIRRDVLVEDGAIIAVEENIDSVNPETRTVDCSAKIMVPGLYDVHVHLREPGREDKESIESGARAALNGGVTGVLAMPNTTPPIDSGGLVRYVLNIAREKAAVTVHTTGCITRGRLGHALAEIGEMHACGAIMITDDGDPVHDPMVLRRAMEYARNFDLILGSHCDVKELFNEGAINEGRASYRLGLPGIAAASEEICMERDLRLAQLTGARVHVQHVSTSRGIEIIRRFKNEGVQVTAEVTPHHLIFNEDDITDYNTHYKMNPPLRTAEDNDKLLEALNDGVFDCLATDHAPHTSFEKNLDFCSAPFGITGLETALASLYDRFISKDKLRWDTVVRCFSAAPRRLLKLQSVALKKGNTAEFLLFDCAKTTTADRDFFCSKSVNSPFYGKTMRGLVEAVVIGGDIKLDRTAANAKA